MVLVLGLMSRISERSVFLRVWGLLFVEFSLILKLVFLGLTILISVENHNANV